MRTWSKRSPGIFTSRPAARSGSISRSKLKFDPLTEVRSFDDLQKFPPFEDEWLRGGPVRRWVPKGLADKPVYVFETGGTTGVPKSRIAVEDFRIDYSLFSDTLPEKYFPHGSNWLMLGPFWPAAVAAGGRASGPASRRHLLLHRSRSAVGHQAHQEGLDGAARSVQAALHRPGDHDSRRRPRRQVHVRHAEADRSALPGARRSAAAACETRASPAFSPAAPSSRRSGRGFASRSSSAARPK